MSVCVCDTFSLMTWFLCCSDTDTETSTDADTDCDIEKESDGEGNRIYNGVVISKAGRHMCQCVHIHPQTLIYFIAVT